MQSDGGDPFLIILLNKIGEGERVADSEPEHKILSEGRIEFR